MNTTQFHAVPLKRMLAGLALTAFASLATFQAAQANSVGGWEQSRGEWEHDGKDHGHCGGDTGLPCGLTNQTATFLQFNSEHDDEDEGIKLSYNDNRTEGISIKYDLTDMIVKSAKLWICARDDAKVAEGTSNGKDLNEMAAITKVEGSTITPDWTEIDGLGWYLGLDVTSYILDPHTSPLTALLAVKNVGSKDFIFKNAKLDITYDTESCPSPVPLPAAAWLFGSALIGFVSMSNRRKV
jgi:hypothetical protein